MQGEGPASPPLLPLCTRDGPLQLRFLSAEEEAQLAAPTSGGGGGSSRASTEQQLALLRRFMDAECLFNGRLGVRLSGEGVVGGWGGLMGGWPPSSAVGS